MLCCTVSPQTSGNRNEFNEPVPGLSKAFGIHPGITIEAQSGNYHIRGALNNIPYTDTMEVATNGTGGTTVIGVIGVKTQFTPNNRAEVVGRFKKGPPAVVRHTYGKGNTVYIGGCPAIAYGKEARFVPMELAEKWPDSPRMLINELAGGVPRLAELSHPVVETGVYDAPTGTVLVLANFTYQNIANLKIRLGLPRACKSVRSLQHGSLGFRIEKQKATKNGSDYPFVVALETRLGLNDIILFE